MSVGTVIGANLVTSLIKCLQGARASAGNRSRGQTLVLCPSELAPSVLLLLLKEAAPKSSIWFGFAFDFVVLKQADSVRVGAQVELCVNRGTELLQGLTKTFHEPCFTDVVLFTLCSEESHVSM